MNGWIDQISLQTTPQRFGNKAFRDCIAKMEAVSPSCCLLPYARLILYCVGRRINPKGDRTHPIPRDPP